MDRQRKKLEKKIQMMEMQPRVKYGFMLFLLFLNLSFAYIGTSEDGSISSISFGISNSQGNSDDGSVSLKIKEPIFKKEVTTNVSISAVEITPPGRGAYEKYPNATEITEEPSEVKTGIEIEGIIEDIPKEFLAIGASLAFIYIAIRRKSADNADGGDYYE